MWSVRCTLSVVVLTMLCQLADCAALKPHKQVSETKWGVVCAVVLLLIVAISALILCAKKKQPDPVVPAASAPADAGAKDIGAGAAPPGGPPKTPEEAAKAGSLFNMKDAYGDMNNQTADMKTSDMFGGADMTVNEASQASAAGKGKVDVSSVLKGKGPAAPCDTTSMTVGVNDPTLNSAMTVA